MKMAMRSNKEKKIQNNQILKKIDIEVCMLMPTWPEKCIMQIFGSYLA